MFKVIACSYDCEYFKSLLTTVCKSTFVTKIWFEFGQYMARPAKVPRSLTTISNIPMLMFAYLFPCKIGTNVCPKILGNNKLVTFVECWDFSFPKDWQLYQQKVSLEVVFQIFQVVILSGMVCLSVFGRGVLMYVCLISQTHGSWFYSWNIFFMEICCLKRIIFLTAYFFLKRINVKCWNSFLMTWKKTSVKWWHQYVFAC